MDMHVRLVFLAGIVQLGIALGSLAVPVLLKWREQLQTVRPLTRQVFWTYACYILGSHVAFGLASVLWPEVFVSYSLLGALVCAYIALHWGGRLLIQFFWFDRSDFPKGIWYIVGEGCLVTCFICLFLLYLSLAIQQWRFHV